MVCPMLDRILQLGTVGKVVRLNRLSLEEEAGDFLKTPVATTTCHWTVKWVALKFSIVIRFDEGFREREFEYKSNISDQEVEICSSVKEDLNFY